MANCNTGSNSRSNFRAWLANSQHCQSASPPFIQKQDEDGFGLASPNQADATQLTNWAPESQDWPEGAFDGYDEEETLPQTTFRRSSAPLSEPTQVAKRSSSNSLPFRDTSVINSLQQERRGIQRRHRPRSLQIAPRNSTPVDSPQSSSKMTIPASKLARITLNTSPFLNNCALEPTPAFLYLTRCKHTEETVKKFGAYVLPDMSNTLAFSGFCTSPVCTLEHLGFLEKNTRKCSCGTKPDLLTIFDSGQVTICKKCDIGICGVVASHMQDGMLTLVCPSCNDCTPFMSSTRGSVALKIVYLADKAKGNVRVEELEEGEIKE